MVKKITLIFIISSIMVLTGSFAQAEDSYQQSTNVGINFYGIGKSEAGIGGWYEAFDDIYITVNVDFQESDHTLSVSGIYMVPRRFLFFKVYGGVGVNYQTNETKTDAHIVGGSEFLWFFSEYEYSLSSSEVRSRSGIRLRF